ncbi:anti-sigma factor [Plantactinospora sp. KBS50]|uniref:anti-sigma factor family protein n=1 Tax=Plantactinospora sp. KBS50 TaxID=2024580 RepID=UPI000BAAD92E|nr:zf-HC2 domain-containing protein [Plantactinospora sp. KBS50]ASW53231.1 anti-sigma factor [Plantactinospora sp. KBS50]
MTSCEFIYDDGAYVLGALAPAERAAYERHLAGCAECREAVAEIAVLPGLLGRLDPAGLESIAGPPEPQSRLPGLIAAARADRRRSRRRTRMRYAGAVLAAAGLALVFGLGVTRLAGDAARPAPSASTVPLAAMRPVRGAGPVTAEVAVTSTAWGSRVTMHCRYPATGDYPETRTFRLVAIGADGAREQVSSWLAAPGDDVTLTGATRLSGPELTRLELQRQDGTPLLGYDVR